MSLFSAVADFLKPPPPLDANVARALDRVLQWGYYVIPNWHIKTWRVAYWNHIGHPAITPRYDIGVETWWSKPQATPAVTTTPSGTP